LQQGERQRRQQIHIGRRGELAALDSLEGRLMQMWSRNCHTAA
jgi:hypothetical protein